MVPQPQPEPAATLARMVALQSPASPRLELLPIQMSFPAQRVAEAAWPPAAVTQQVRGAQAAPLVSQTLKRACQLSRYVQVLRRSRQVRVGA
jgi:hypothetical protein